MDASAIVHASDQVLRGLGLKTGDILSLRAYVSEKQDSKKDEERQARKASLIEQLLEQKKTTSGGSGTKRKSESQTGSKKQKQKSSKKVQIGWMHYNEEQQRYVPVRMAKGGGARDIDMPVNANIEHVKESSASLFFPNGTSFFGKLDEMELSVGNYQGDVLSSLKDASGVTHAFSIQKYYEINKTTRARLYLMSRQKKSSSLSTPQSCSEDAKAVENEPEAPDNIIVIDQDEASDDELYYPSFLDSDWVDHIEPSIDHLIGSSSERTSLIAEQDDSFQQSQAYDLLRVKEKADEEAKKADDAIRANQLRMERSDRVPDEPDDNRNAVLVNVRHVNLGLQSRSFPSNGTVSYVYDWVGSLNAYPENFRLFKMPREEVSPSDQITAVHKCTLFMEIVENPILLSPIGEVSMPGYGAIDEQYHVEPIPMVSTAITASPKQPAKVELDEYNYKTLCEKQKLSLNQLKHHNYEGHLVRRDDVVNQLLKLYRDGLVDTSKIAFLRFEGEDGAGDGVTCDVFSSFWDEFYSKFCEGSGQCVPCLTVQFSADDFKAIGKIITHMFVSYQIFPVRLSEALFQYCLFGAVTDECIVSSFLNLLSTHDRGVIQKCIENPSLNFNRDEVMDILNDFNIVSLPSKDNLLSLIINAAQLTIISKPLFLITNIKEGLGQFWDEVTPGEIRSIYELSVPTAERLLSALSFNVANETESKIARWLERFIRNSGEDMLRRLVRYCTSLPMLLPNKSIGVAFVDQSPNHLHPVGAACFKILKLPRQYMSYSQLKENLDFYLANSHLWNMSE
jgi:hypothetical protein